MEVWKANKCGDHGEVCVRRPWEGRQAVYVPANTLGCCQSAFRQPQMASLLLSSLLQTATTRDYNCAFHDHCTPAKKLKTAMRHAKRSDKCDSPPSLKKRCQLVFSVRTPSAAWLPIRD
jgi:hypothetical protein